MVTASLSRVFPVMADLCRCLHFGNLQLVSPQDLWLPLGDFDQLFDSAAVVLYRVSKLCLSNRESRCGSRFSKSYKSSSSLVQLVSPTTLHTRPCVTLLSIFVTLYTCIARGNSLTFVGVDNNKRTGLLESLLCFYWTITTTDFDLSYLVNANSYRHATFPAWSSVQDLNRVKISAKSASYFRSYRPEKCTRSKVRNRRFSKAVNLSRLKKSRYLLIT